MNKQIVKKPFRVAIEGNVGSGKSTLIKYFGNYKNVETNPVIFHFLIFILLFCTYFDIVIYKCNILIIFI